MSCCKIVWFQIYFPVATPEPQQEPPLPVLEDDLLERIDNVDDGSLNSSSSDEENLEQDLDLDNRIAEALLRDRRKHKGCLSVCLLCVVCFCCSSVFRVAHMCAGMCVVV